MHTMSTTRGMSFYPKAAAAQRTAEAARHAHEESQRVEGEIREARESRPRDDRPKRRRGKPKLTAAEKRQQEERHAYAERRAQWDEDARAASEAYSKRKGKGRRR